MLIEVMVPPPEVAANSWVPAEFDDRLTVNAVVLTLPKASCSCTVIGPSVALLEVVPDTAPVVKTSLDAVPAVIVSCWVPEVSPVAAAVSVGVPGFSSL